MTAAEAAQSLSLSRTLIYALLRRGELKSFKVGKRRLIPMSELEEFVTRRLDLELWPIARHERHGRWGLLQTDFCHGIACLFQTQYADDLLLAEVTLAPAHFLPISFVHAGVSRVLEAVLSHRSSPLPLSPSPA